MVTLHWCHSSELQMRAQKEYNLCTVKYNILMPPPCFCVSAYDFEWSNLADERVAIVRGIIWLLLLRQVNMQQIRPDYPKPHQTRQRLQPPRSPLCLPSLFTHSDPNFISLHPLSLFIPTHPCPTLIIYLVRLSLILVPPPLIPNPTDHFMCFLLQTHLCCPVQKLRSGLCKSLKTSVINVFFRALDAARGVISIKQLYYQIYSKGNIYYILPYIIHK